MACPGGGGPRRRAGRASRVAGALFCWHLLPMMEPCLLPWAGGTALPAGKAPGTESLPHCSTWPDPVVRQTLRWPLDPEVAGADGSAERLGTTGLQPSPSVGCPAVTMDPPCPQSLPPDLVFQGEGGLHVSPGCGGTGEWEGMRRTGWVRDLSCSFPCCCVYSLWKGWEGNSLWLLRPLIWGP